MTTVQIIQGALDTLRRDGWHQGGYISSTGAVCLTGAIVAAHGIDLVFQCSASFRNAEHCDAVIVIRQLIGTDEVYVWNDAPERTFADIEAVLTAAIAIASKDQPAPVEVPA